MTRLAVLASGTGSILKSLLDHGLPVCVVLVDRACGAAEIAETAAIPVERVIRSSYGRDFDREAYSEQVVAALRAHDVELVAMAGYGTVLGRAAHEAFPGRIVNTHPALLPAFKGWHAVEAALEAGVGETGCTVHIATLEVDEGPILAQEPVTVLPDDTVESLHERIKEVERRIYPLALRQLMGDGPGMDAWPSEAGASEAGTSGTTNKEHGMRALLSVYDKTGLAALAKGLEGLGWELVASGNTSRALDDAGVAHLTVESVTGSPEMLGGRVKTLHPRIHGGILADLGQDQHRADLEAAGIEPIDLVVVNLYPFGSEPSIEMIDIGGPTMVRAAAKNHDRVTVVVDPSDYGPVLDELRREGEVGLATRRRLARAAFAHVAAYDAAIVSWFDSDVLPSGPTASGTGRDDDPLPPTVHLSLERAEELRYGENPHQRAALYRVAGSRGGATAGTTGGSGWWEHATQHGGRELSYLNYFDADAAWRLAHELRDGPIGSADSTGTVRTAAVIVKHANPCGAAIQPGTAPGDLATAYQRAFEADPLSAFGGIVALTGLVDLALAEQIVANPLADVLIAAGYDEGALELLGARRKNMRTLTAPPPGPPRLALRQIDGGYLVQEPDLLAAPRHEWRCATSRIPTEEEWSDAELAWLVCARTGSNAIVLAKAGQVVGVGCGQQSRVDAAGLAARKAAGRAEGGAGASDAFFPFRDGMDAVADSGVAVIVQPGGSLRDDEVVGAADERNIAMVLTGERHFRH